jgi:hypothetical protein
MRHYSKWVYPRQQHHPSFEDLPPLLCEYKLVVGAIMHTARTVGLLVGCNFGLFILSPLTEGIFASF